MTDMVEAMRAYQANASVIDASQKYCEKYDSLYLDKEDYRRFYIKR